MIAVGRAIEHLRQTARIDSGLEGGRSLGAERPTIYGTVGIALDVKHLAIFNVYIKDGKVIDIEGNADSPINRGTLCSKEAGTIQYTVNANRMTQVLYRVSDSDH